MKTSKSDAYSVLVAASFAAITALGATGCDAGKEPFLKAAALEESGDYRGAVPLYEEVCQKKSPLCDAATKRKARLAIKDAWKAFSDGKYRDAKATLDAASASGDTTTVEEAKALAENPDLAAGIAFEDALAPTDKASQLGAIEKLASEPTSVAPKAKEWLDKNRPALLLAAAKAACVEKGVGSCFETAQKLGKYYPGSPEAKEAEGLQTANYKRLYPRLKDVENLLIQRLGVHDRDTKEELCQKTGMSAEECGEKYSGQGPKLDYLERFWSEKLALVDDPSYKSRFESRWGLAAQGEYDAEPWPKP